MLLSTDSDSWSDRVTYEVITRNWVCWRRRGFRVCVCVDDVIVSLIFFLSGLIISYDYCVSQFDTASNLAGWSFRDSHISFAHDFLLVSNFRLPSAFRDRWIMWLYIKISMLSAAHVTKSPNNDYKCFQSVSRRVGHSYSAACGMHEIDQNLELSKHVFCVRRILLRCANSTITLLHL